MKSATHFRCSLCICNGTFAPV